MSEIDVLLVFIGFGAGFICGAVGLLFWIVGND